MAFDQLGISFLPQGNGSTQLPAGRQLEDVLRVLSFRLPRVLGTRPIAPAELLNSQGGAGDPLGSAVAQQVIQQVLGGSPGGAPGGAPDPGALSNFFAPALGPGKVQGPADLPPARKPRVLPIEEPPTISEPQPERPARVPFQQQRRPRRA